MNKIITDTNFETFGSPESKWAIIIHQGVSMNATLEDSVLSLDISDTSGANWHGELRYAPFEVSVGDRFEISFFVKAKNAFTFSVWLGQMESPYASLVPTDNHFGEETMTDEWQTFAHIWEPFMNEANVRLNFVLGQIDNVVEIKNVSLTKVA